MQQLPTSTPPTATTQEERIRAYEKAFDLFDAQIIRYFVHMTHDHHLAEDLSQELWLNIYKYFRTDQFFHIGLIMRKAYQVFIDNARKRNVRSFVIFKRELPEIISPEIFAEPGTESEEEALKERWMNMFPGIGLTDAQKEVFWLKERYGYTYEEIAKKLNLPVSTLHDGFIKAKREYLAFLNRNEQ